MIAGRGLRAAASVAGKAHVNDFRQQLYNKPQFHRAGRRQFRAWNLHRRFWAGGLGYVDHLVYRDGRVAESDGTCSECGAGKDRRGSDAFRRPVTYGDM
jgi:hypothetical protein